MTTDSKFWSDLYSEIEKVARARLRRFKFEDIPEVMRQVKMWTDDPAMQEKILQSIEDSIGTLGALKNLTVGPDIPKLVARHV